jgi:hypothetical protein
VVISTITYSTSCFYPEGATSTNELICASVPSSNYYTKCSPAVETDEVLPPDLGGGNDDGGTDELTEDEVLYYPCENSFNFIRIADGQYAVVKDYKFILRDRATGKGDFVTNIGMIEIGLPALAHNDSFINSSAAKRIFFSSRDSRDTSVGCFKRPDFSQSEYYTFKFR